MSAVLALALADFRERLRRRSFLAVLAAAGFLGLQAIQGRVEVALGDYTGEPSSAWAGALLALVGSTFLALAGFWMVKGSIARDEATGVGQILAATPIRKTTYTLGKALSHFLVLAAMTGVLALAAVTLILVTPAAGRLDLLAIATPLVWITLPGLAIVAAAAVLFETIRLLARGFGNFVWFFAWPVLLVMAMEAGGPDLFGIVTMQRRLGEEVRRLDPGIGSSFRIGIGGLDDRATRRFRWEGLDVTTELASQRAGVFALAVLVAAVAALPFDRFDPARRKLRVPRRRKRPAEMEAEAVSVPAAEAAAAGTATVADLPAVSHIGGFRFGGLLASELRVAMRSMPRWWPLGVAALTIGGLVAPAGAKLGWLVAGFAWPALLWSGLATRDRATGVAPLLASAPRPLTRQLPAVILAGWLAGLSCAGGPIVGLALGGDVTRAAAAAIGCLAMPALAVGLGVLSGGPRLFEAIFVTLWYIGPLQRGWPVDFAGVSAIAAARLVPAWFLAVAAALLVVALGLERARRVSGEARFVA
jgi:hypothetical protein